MPRIYAACLASYNAGILHGAWINVDGNATSDLLLELIDEMLKASPMPGSEEYAIHDYEDFPQACVSRWGEHPDLDSVCLAGQGLDTWGEVFEAALQHEDSVGAAFEACDNGQFIGQGDSEADIVAEWLEETGTLSEIPENLRNYFDFEAYARDLRLGGEWSFVRLSSTVYAFSNV